jgi:fatty acid omega-hydroxylase
MLPSLIANTNHRYYDWMTRILIANGGSFRFEGPWRSNFQVLYTADPRNVEHVLRTNFGNYPKGPEFMDAFRDLLGDGIFNADGDLWRMQRKASSLHLHSRACRQFTDALVLESVEKKLLPALALLMRPSMNSRLDTDTDTGDGDGDGFGTVPVDAVVDLQDLMLRFTLDTICMVAFGHDPGSLDSASCRPGIRAGDHNVTRSSRAVLVKGDDGRGCKDLGF